MKNLYLLIISILVSCNVVENKPKVDLKSKITHTGIFYEKLKNLKENEILVCAHRACHTEAPENSILAINNAIKNNIDIVEIDVRTTVDDSLILMHDYNVDRTTDSFGKVSTKTFNEIRKLRLKYNNEITSQKVPTLREALILTKGKILVNLDIKSASNQKIYIMIKELGMIDQIIFYDGDRNQINSLYQLDNKIQVFPLCRTEDDVVYYINSIQPLLLHFTSLTYHENIVALAHRKNSKVFMNILGDIESKWVNGDTDMFNSFLEKGVDIVQTDRPVKLLNYLRSIGRHN